MQMDKQERERLLQWAMYMIDRCLAKAEMLNHEVEQLVAQAESYTRLAGKLADEGSDDLETLEHLQERITELADRDDDDEYAL